MASPALADSNSINFGAPDYHPGSISGQGGWSNAVNPAYDQAVVVNNTAVYPTFGSQTFRMSNAVTSGSFGDWVYAKPLVDPAGETSATAGAFGGGTRQTRFQYQFDIASAVPGAEQPGLRLTMSADRGDGSRMNFIRVSDNPTGLAVDFDDVQGTTNPANFVETRIASGLSRTVPHTIKVSTQFNEGASNDVVRVFVDNVQVHTGTTWENYYRFDSEASAEQSTRLVRTVLFRAGGTAAPLTLGHGFFIDKLTITSGS